MIHRIRLGLAPGSQDAVFLGRDIAELDAALRAGRPADELLRYATEIEAEARRLRIPEAVAKALTQQADVLLGVGRYAKALAAARAAEDARAALGGGRPDLAVGSLARQAEAHAGLGDWAAVSAVCGRGILLAESLRDNVSPPYLQGAYLRSWIGLYTRGVEAAYARGDYPLLFERAELSKGRSVLRYGPAPAAPGESLEQQFRRACEEVDAARAAGAGRVPEPLLAKRRTLWDLLLIRRGRERAEIPAFDLDRVRASLAADEAALYYYWLDPGRLLVATLDRQEVVVELRPVSRARRDELEGFAAFVLGFQPGTDGATFSRFDDAEEFSDLLLPVTGRRLLEGQGKRRLIVSPHRVLHAVPFHALVWDGRYLARRFATSYAPNLTSLLVSHRRSPPAVLALGTCEFEARQGDGKPLAPLRDAEREVEEVERVYADRGVQATSLPGRQAVKGRLAALDRAGELARYSCLHFATHGLNVPADNPMESCLFTRDGVLDGLEIANWRLSGPLVVLSACCSGQRPTGVRHLAELPGDDVFGLQAAFFAAGASAILGSLWPVQSPVACAVAARFHSLVAGGEPADLALQAAQLGALGATRRVYDWAPFFLARTGRLQGH